MTAQRVIWRFPDVKAATGLGRTKIYSLMKLGLFPKGVRIAGAKAIGWDSVAVKAWVAAQFDTEHDA